MNNSSGTGLDMSDLIGIASALIAIVACGISIVFALKSSSHSSQANAISKASLERNLRTQITNSQIAMRDIAFRVEDQKSNGNVKPVTISAFRSAIEDYLNAHEIAAQYYLDAEINKDRYKSEYRKEIKNLCDIKKEGFARVMHPMDQSDYQNIWKVYIEFHGEYK